MAAQAQYTARAFHMLESVKMDVASRKSATLDLQMEETMTRHGVFVMRTRADLNIGISRGREQRIANQRFQQAACNWCWTNILQELAGGLTMTSPRQWFAPILRTHATKNDARQQRQETSRLVQQAKTQRVAMSWTASCMEVKLLVFWGIDSVGDSMHILAKFEDSRHKK